MHVGPAVVFLKEQVGVRPAGNLLLIILPIISSVKSINRLAYRWCFVQPKDIKFSIVVI